MNVTFDLDSPLNVTSNQVQLHFTAWCILVHRYFHKRHDYTKSEHSERKHKGTI
jgi:hypothetical protein